MRITLTITREPDGSIGVAGPLQDKVVCYGLLEAARDAIKDHHDKAQASAIQAPSARDVLALTPRG